MASKFAEVLIYRHVMLVQCQELIYDRLTRQRLILLAAR